MNAPLRCPHCQQPISPGMHFCSQCGTALQAPFQQSALPLVGPSRERSTVLEHDDQATTTTISITGSLPDIVKQMDQSASTNVSISGVLIGFYSGAIFAGKVVSGAVLNAILYALPLCLLLVAIVFALRVFHPDISLSDEYALIKKKEQRLRFSSIYLQVAVGVLIVAVFVYLIRPQA